MPMENTLVVAAYGVDFVSCGFSIYIYYTCRNKENGGRKHCSTVAPLQRTTAKKEAQRRRKRRGREVKRNQEEEEKFEKNCHISFN